MVKEMSNRLSEQCTSIYVLAGKCTVALTELYNTAFGTLRRAQYVLQKSLRQRMI